MPPTQPTLNVQVSLEHIELGDSLPEWLVELLESPTGPRLLIIHSSDSARKQALELLRTRSSAPLESSLHQTIDRLLETLHADLHLPRALPDDGATLQLVHSACTAAAKELAFAFIHPVPEKEWAMSRTKRLAKLHKALSEEDKSIKWESDPGVKEFDSVVAKLESTIERIHPARRLSAIVSSLGEWFDTGSTPFSLIGLDGIIVLDQPPSLSWLRRKLLTHLSLFTPLHQLSHAGRFRIGEHGGWLVDEAASRNSESLPDFVSQSPSSSPPTDIGGGLRTPWRAPGVVSWDGGNTTRHRISLGRRSHTIGATFELLKSFEENCGGSVLIIDAALSARRNEWAAPLSERGWTLPSQSVNLRANPLIHWLLVLAKMPHGDEAWSLNTLRSLALQETLPFSGSWLDMQHPIEGGWRPRPSVSILEEISRSGHILGGRGAMEKWLTSLSTWRPDPLRPNYEKMVQELEETQWWFRSLVERMMPLLNETSSDILQEMGPLIGISSGCELPLPASPTDGDDWLMTVLSTLDWQQLIERFDGGVSGLQKLVELYNRARVLLSSADYHFPINGLQWVNSLELLVEDASMTSVSLEGDLRLLSPESARGCSADLVILAGLSSQEWSMKPNLIPWLDTEARLSLGILRPDEPLRDARHDFRSMLNAASTVIILDPSMDSESHPSAPLSEWLASLSKPELARINSPPSFVDEADWDVDDAMRKWDLCLNEESGVCELIPRPAAVEVVDSKVQKIITGSRQQNNRLNCGLSISEGNVPFQSPLNPSTVLNGWSVLQMKDRIAREPTAKVIEEYWQPNSAHSHFMSLEKIKLSPPNKWPRSISSLRLASDWPLLSSRVNHTTISPVPDPRPFLPSELGLTVFDSMHGRDAKMNLKERIWSASRLQAWVDCPRRGWLEKRLRAEEEEEMRQDIDARTRGTLHHESIAQLISENLNISIGLERVDFTPPTLALVTKDPLQLMGEYVSIIIRSAPWLFSGDAIASQRREDLLSMTLEEIESHLENPVNREIKGNFGTMLSSELTLVTSALLGMELPLNNGTKDYATIFIPKSPEGKESLGKIKIRGRIDRVELFPLEDGWINEDGVEEVCPLDINTGTSWIARRHVIIRDLKTVKGPEKKDERKRHNKALFDEVQLALYARAWEVSHPGDRVVGVGITEAGETVTHHLEVDAEIISLQTTGLGIISNRFEDMFRRPLEGSKPSSNSFRAWLRHRLSVAVLTSNAAEKGLVIPTPSKSTCQFCSVKEICGLSSIYGGDE